MDEKAIIERLEADWACKPPYGDKVRRYIGKFEKRQVRGGDVAKITAEVLGNHGTYRVSVNVHETGGVFRKCSCYIGKHGCHHSSALAATYIQSPETFTFIKPPPRLDVNASTTIQDMASLEAYLKGVTLDDLIGELKKHKITQKAFAESIGMSSRHLSAVKSAERQNRQYHELGATKLACLWVLENMVKTKKKKKRK